MAPAFSNSVRVHRHPENTHAQGAGLAKGSISYDSSERLMFEMQGIRMMHCTIWSEGVREIVSAEDADVKFIISDHPVTIYNYAAPPEAPLSPTRMIPRSR